MNEKLVSQVMKIIMTPCVNGLSARLSWDHEARRLVVNVDGSWSDPSLETIEVFPCSAMWDTGKEGDEHEAEIRARVVEFFHELGEQPECVEDIVR